MLGVKKEADVDNLGEFVQKPFDFSKGYTADEFAAFGDSLKVTSLKHQHIGRPTTMGFGDTHGDIPFSYTKSGGVLPEPVPGRRRLR